jgi:hypothetical protein
MIPGIIALVVLGVIYWLPVRRWFATWGTTPDELTRQMAGDAIIADPTDTATQAVTVNAPPEAVWPWLVQLGYQRGGLYSYDWLDRLFKFLDRPSATRVMPEFQTLEVGDRIFLGARMSLTVAALDANRALVLANKTGDMEWVWQFGLYPVDACRTRLVSRGIEHMPATIGSWLSMRIMEPAAFIMTRKMLLTLKKRAEQLANAQIDLETAKA